jgi:signal transduction histidine kinase
MRWNSGGEVDRGYGLIALLLVAVLVPTACVLWFMNEALTSQASASRQSALEAFRGQLRFVRGRIDDHWQTRAATLNAGPDVKPGAAFRRAVTEGRADAVIVLDRSGAVLYPSAGVHRPATVDAAIAAARRLEAAPGRDAVVAYSSLLSGEKGASRAARLAQGLVRSLVRRGDREAAVLAIEQHFVRGVAARGVDRDGRMMAADAQLLAAQLLEPGSRRDAFIHRLAELLNDYEAVAIPSAQRLFLMNELSELASDIPFPTRDAERLAISVVEANTVRLDAGLRPTTVPGVWQLASADQHVVALYRDDLLQNGMTTLLAQYGSPAVRFGMIPPGGAPDDESVAAGPALPGWQISFVLSETSGGEDVASSRRAAYLWLGALAVGVMVTSAAGLARSVRRQARLARLKTDLVAIVSHELRTPVTSMRVLVDALLTDPQPDPATSREYLRLVANENVRLSRLIENFLTFSRLDRRRYRFSFAPTSPDEVVQAAVEGSRDRMPAGDGNFEIDIAPGLPTVSVDTDALVTALMNLLDNAWKYTPGDKRIALKVFQDGRDVVFAVQDNGVGIPLHEQKRVFHRFYQVDQRLARETGGCGLGLSIVQSIVRAHGGTVHVDSAPNRGSTFALRIPWRHQDAAA